MRRTRRVTSRIPWSALDVSFARSAPCPHGPATVLRSRFRWWVRTGGLRHRFSRPDSHACGKEFSRARATLAPAACVTYACGGGDAREGGGRGGVSGVRGGATAPAAALGLPPLP